MTQRRSGIRHRARRDAMVVELLERDGDRCWYCRCRFGVGGRTLTLDHVDPLADGGRTTASNLRLACRTCNRRKGRMGSDSYLSSKLLGLRRAQVEREEQQASGLVLAKRAFSHVGIRWDGPWRWTCRDCGQSGGGPSESPAATPCRGDGRDGDDRSAGG